MIVDYEKSIIEFANSNPEGFEQVKRTYVYYTQLNNMEFTLYSNF